MNESEFEELVNLYFDQEISVAELKCLKKELAARVDRRSEFRLRYRLHRATCSVLSTETVELSKQSTLQASTSGYLKYRPALAWVLGMAACLLIIFNALIRIPKGSGTDVDTFVAESADSPNEVYNAGNVEPEFRFQGNLNSQLQLASLTSESVPMDQQLSRFSIETLRQREAGFQDMINQIDTYGGYPTISELELVEPFGRTYEATSGGYWPTDFKSSLASFK